MDFVKYEKSVVEMKRLEAEKDEATETATKLLNELQRYEAVARNAKEGAHLIRQNLQDLGLYVVKQMSFLVRGESQSHVVSLHEFNKKLNVFLHPANASKNSMVNFCDMSVPLHAIDAEGRRKIFPRVDETPIDDIVKALQDSIADCEKLWETSTVVEVSVKGRRLLGLAFVSKQHAEKVLGKIRAGFFACKAKVDIIDFKVVDGFVCLHQRFPLMWPDGAGSFLHIENALETCLQKVRLDYSDSRSLADGEWTV